MAGVSKFQHVVVTGAGGFAGSHVARYLDACGHQVTAVLRRSNPVVDLPEKIARVAGDLRKPALLPARFDSLIHCAAEIPARCPDPEVLYATNVACARAVFEAARQAGARSVVFMSSMSHYGQVAVPVITEDLAPISPDRYGQSKTEGERLLAEAVAAGLPSGLSIRLPGTVGKGSHDNFLSSTLMRAMAGAELVARHPDALFNNIVCASDLACFLDRWIAAPRPGNFATNLAASEPVPIRAVFSEMFRELGWPERVAYDSQGKPPFRIAIEHARELGYHCPTTLDSVRAFVRDSVT